MAKIRVYELAKKLSMTNKAFLTKLRAMDIEVKSHMSSLEDETVVYIKETLFGEKNKTNDTRVRASVIRRRKKKEKKNVCDISLKEEAEESVPDGSSTPFQTSRKPITAETGAVVDKVSANKDKENISSDAVDPAEAAKDASTDKKSEELDSNRIAGQSPLDAAESNNQTKKRSNVSNKAKVITPASKSETKELVKKNAVAEVQDKKDTSIFLEEPAAKKGEQIENLRKIEPDVPKKSENSKQKKVSPISDNHQTGEPLDKTEKNKENRQQPSTEDIIHKKDKSLESKEASPSQNKKRKRKKRQKKVEPAKIIKLAVPPPAVSNKRKNAAVKNGDLKHSDPEPAERKKIRSEHPARKSSNIPEPIKTSHHAQEGDIVIDNIEQAGAKRKKDKKKKWASGDPDKEDKAIKSSQRKRKSVVEGKDLYEKTGGRKKSRKKDGKAKRPKAQKTQITVPKAIKRRIKIDETIELSELAKRMGTKANEMIRKLMGMGVMVTLNQTIDFDTASLVAAEFDYEVEKAAAAEDMLIHAHDEDDPDALVSRSPVVTIMGHVDHGKTSLLDVIRKSKITTGEAGGITQHIGAYSVETPNGVITFLDTPGHAAFTSMRSRGAQVTDLVVLVVAADDGVMPQTIEAINHSKAANVPVVVAVNKMDKPDADPDRVMRELSDHGLLAEDWGGDVIFAKVSAKAETGIDELLEMILLQAEVLELKANPDRPAMGHVIEARLDAGRGPVATVLVQHGTLKAGQPVVCGLHSGKIRAMVGDLGETIDEAGPSTPVEIIGLSGVPEAGDEFIALESEKDAKQISESRMQKERAKDLAKKSRANLEKLFANMGTNEIKELKLIIKADVHGSLEALNESIVKLAQDEVDIKIVHSGTGAINESDVSLATVSDAIIIGFNVRPTPKVREMAKEENVDMRFYDIIYNVINDIKAALTGLMPSTFHEIIIGRAEVRDTFVIPGKGTIAGCYVLDGKVARGEKIRLLREGVIKCNNELLSLRRFKDDVKEVTQGYECGIGIEKFNDIKVGDIVECYEIEERKASLESIK